MGKSFVKRVLDRAKNVKSHIIFAFDPDESSGGRSAVWARIQNILSELKGTIVGVKFGLPAILALGPDGVGEVIDSFRKNYFFICDSKMADIGHVNRLVAGQIFGLGFDALIVHAFIGTKDGIDEVVKLARGRGRGVLAVCAMTHAGANEHLNKRFDALLTSAASAGADGFVLPATFPVSITKARRKYPRALIVSPGVGAQGAPFGSAIAAGANFEIIGRAIACAPSPAERAKEIKEARGEWRQF